MKIAENVTELVGNTPNMAEEKQERLRGILRSLESVTIAYSGGVDIIFQLTWRILSWQGSMKI
jgi:hypothetical protein